MSLLDATARAQLDQEVINPLWLVFLDFLGDPARANSSGENITITGSSLPDLNGDYIGIDARFVEVGPVKSSSGGGESVSIRLSGIRGLDDDDRTLLADPANWQGRVCRMWQIIRNAANVQQGATRHYYTGYMMSLGYQGNAEETTIELTVEGYLSGLSGASGRTYLTQEEYDAGDLSAKAAIAIANGNDSANIISGASVAPFDAFGNAGVYGFNPYGGGWYY